MSSLHGKVVFVAGAGSGIGRSTALRLAGEGAAVAAVDPRGERAEATRSGIAAAGGTAVAIACDVSDEARVHESVAITVQRLGPPTLLVNSVAAYPRKEFLEHSLDEWRRTLAVCFFSYILTMREIVPHMIAAGGGKIVNIASVAAHIGFGFPVTRRSSLGHSRCCRQSARTTHSVVRWVRATSSSWSTTRSS